MSKKLVVSGFIIILAVTAGIYLHKRELQKGKDSIAERNQIILVERRDLSETVDGDGVVVFSKNGGIYPAYKATVQKIHCHAGDKVKKGDLLMVLTSDTLQSSWVEAEHRYQMAQLNLSLAEKALERQKKLYEVQGTTLTELESAQNAVAQNRLSLQEAASKLELLTQTTDEANFIGEDHRTIMIRAPFNGEVAWIEAKLGQIVSAIGSSSSDSSSKNLLLYLVAEDSLEVEATVDETDIDLVKMGQKAKVILNDTNQTEIYGVVAEVGSYGSNDSGVIVFPVKIRLDKAGVTVRPQMTADVSIYITFKPDVISIPKEAVLNIRGKTMVRKVARDGGGLTEVELGVASASYVEVLSGLKEGERISVIPKDDHTKLPSSNRKGNQTTPPSSNRQPRPGRIRIGGPM